MNKKVGDVFRILLGCYLIFLGVSLWIQVSKAGPADEQLMTLFAVILIAVGIVSFLVSVLALVSRLKGKGHFRKRNKKTASDDTVEIRLDEQWNQSAAVNTTERPVRKPTAEEMPVIEESGRTEEIPVIKDVDKTEEMPVIKDADKTEEMPVIKDIDKTEEMPEIEDVEKTEEIESDYEEK